MVAWWLGGLVCLVLGWLVCFWIGQSVWLLSFFMQQGVGLEMLEMWGHVAVVFFLLLL